MMKALVIMMIRRLYSAHALLRFLEQDDPVLAPLRPLLVAQGRFPSRRPWERRLARLPTTLPGLLGSTGRSLVTMRKPWTPQGRAVSLASMALATAGGVWQTKHRALGEMPHSSMDTEAGWSKAGWHGWWYGWKLPLAVTVGAVWRPLAAERTVAHHADHKGAPRLLEQVPLETRSVLGDTHDHDPELRCQCQRRGAELVATRRGAYPYQDGGAAVRTVLHPLRSQAIAPCNGLCKGVFE
jgi:hypothetical protein